MPRGRRDIFRKLRLTPGQLRAVAERRFQDAQYLLDSRNQQRANGAIYMAGFVVELLLKAALLERHPNLQAPVDPAHLSKSDKEVFELLYSHKLEDMLGFIPELRAKLGRIKTASGRSAWRALSDICEEWTVYVRYSPAMAKLEQAEEYLNTVREVKRWLRQP